MAVGGGLVREGGAFENSVSFKNHRSENKKSLDSPANCEVETLRELSTTFEFLPLTLRVFRFHSLPHPGDARIQGAFYFILAGKKPEYFVFERLQYLD